MLSRHLWCRDSDLTQLKQPWLGPHKIEAKHSRSSAKASTVEEECKKNQHRGSDKKPSVLETE